jgi:hypothetical protein
MGCFPAVEPAGRHRPSMIVDYEDRPHSSALSRAHESDCEPLRKIEISNRSD